LRANETDGGAMATYLITHEVDDVDHWVRMETLLVLAES
jgi:hypothetical protein